MKPIVSKKFAIITAAVCIVIAIAAALILPTALGKTDLEKQLDLGQRCLVELDYEGAILAFERAIEIDPNNVDAYVGLAQAYLALDRTDDARALFEKSYTVFGNVEVMLGAASALSENGDYEAAIFALEIALQYDAKNENIYILLADAYMALGREDDARAILEAGLLETGSEAIAKKLNELFPAETDEVTESEAVTETESVTKTEIVTETETETDTEAVTEEVDGTETVETEEVTEPVTEAVTEPVTTEVVTEEVTTPVHTHTYASAWKTNQTEHWQECSCGAKSGLAAHSYSAWVTTKEATESAEGNKTRSCNTCGYKETASIPVLEHTHVFGGWVSDATSHWKVCSCGNIKDKANHNYTSVVTRPTKAEMGYTTHTCGICGNSYVDSYVDALVIPDGYIDVGYCGDNVTWKLDESGVLTISGTGEINVITAEGSGWKQYSIPWSKYSDRIISVIIEEGITSTGSCGLFEDYGNLVNVTLPNSLTEIGANMFSNCASLASINIPDNVKSIGEYVFAYCYNLKSVHIPASVEYIDANTFWAICDFMEYISYDGTVEQFEALELQSGNYWPGWNRGYLEVRCIDGTYWVEYGISVVLG